MLNVKLYERKSREEVGIKSSDSYVSVNGISDEDSQYSYFYAADKKTECDIAIVSFHSKKVIEILSKYSFEDVSEFFTRFSYQEKNELRDDCLDISVVCAENISGKLSGNDNIQNIRIILRIDWNKWAKPWSISSFANELEQTITSSKNKQLRYSEHSNHILEGLGIVYFPGNKNLLIRDEVDSAISILLSLVAKANKNLQTAINRDSVLTYFQFPKEIKSACTQYLIYFSQFLADVGISVSSETKEEANYTLFKITPKDENEGLTQIRQALEIYLTAPSVKDFDIQVAHYPDLAIQQWQVNIYHLKSQILLANSIIQAKEATIESLQLSNYQYKQLLESNTTKKESEKEEVIKGVVSVGKYESKGFTINLAEIFRRLKRVIKK